MSNKPFLSIIPKDIVNPKKVNYCVACCRVYSIQRVSCLNCNSFLKTIEHISYLANVLRQDYIEICPRCNSADILHKKMLTDLKKVKCQNCLCIFGNPKKVNRLEWIHSNYPELVE